MTESQHLGKLIGIAPKQIYEIFKAGTDWEFIIKIDALLEAAAKKVVKASLVNGYLTPVEIDEFVDALPIRGRTSLLKLLQASGCDAPERNLIDAVRTLRNGFAHDITQMNMSLIEVVKKRKDKTTLLKSLSWVDEFDEQVLTTMYEKDGGQLRFGIVTGALIFMIAAYHSVVRDWEEIDAAPAGPQPAS
jgi:hypothetical protein